MYRFIHQKQFFSDGTITWLFDFGHLREIYLFFYEQGKNLLIAMVNLQACDRFLCMPMNVNKVNIFTFIFKRSDRIKKKL